ncbi:MAG: A/G-specific adenine glycosylase [Butyricicoccus sp.]|nr:A/G-specific adenine glycosylase [Butyricicoccus sp.]
MCRRSSLTEAIIRPLLAWYEENKRDLPWRRTRDPYRIWLSEIMLQQTRVEAVIPYYERFLRACPTVQDLAAADEQTYLKLWEGLGYYSRVRNLHKAACVVCEQYGGEFPADHAALLKLPGIGDYTAGAVGSIAFGLREPAVDGNVLRVLARIDEDFRPIDDAKVKKEMRAVIAALVPADAPGAFNQALMELGATVCLPNGAPKCGDCPVRHLCAAAEHGTALLLPRKSPKKGRTIVERAVVVFRCGELVGLRRRPDTGLLAGLWELPAYEPAPQPDALRTILQEEGYALEKLLSLRPAKHIFTHIEWHMTGYYAELSAPHPALTWVTPGQMRGEYALPSAFRAFLQVIEEGS